MKDEIFWGNLIGLLKNGRWNLSGSEAVAFNQIFEECHKRASPKKPTEVKEPIVKSAPIKGKKDANK
jgi:hypothetical protein